MIPPSGGRGERRGSIAALAFWVALAGAWLVADEAPGVLAANPAEWYRPATARFDHPAERYDLVVYGGTPAGVAAAVSAARRGLHVLLIEPDREVGGVLTRAWLATLDVTFDPSGRLLQQGQFLEFFRSLGWDPSFDVGRARSVLESELRMAGVPVKLSTHLAGVPVRDGRVLQVGLRGEGPDARLEWVSAPLFVDASDTAELAWMAGARFTVGREDGGLDRAQMAAGLVFRLSGVSWDTLCTQARAEARSTHSTSGCRGRSAWGWANLASGYPPGDPWRFSLRGLNMALQDDGSVLVNALLVLGVDGTDPASVERAYDSARLEVTRVASYLRDADPAGFGNAWLAGVAPRLYLRESRHLVGLYRLRADDVLMGRLFPDGVALGGYPMDGQVYLPGELPYLLGVPAAYAVPFRSLVPVGLRNLLVASQAASFDSAAAFSARVVPLQMALGEAAGVAAYIALQRGDDFPTLAASPEGISALRRLLIEEGARLHPGPSWSGRPGPARSSGKPAGDGWLAENGEQQRDDFAHPEYPEAVELLRRGLFQSSYDLRGGLYLGAPATWGEFLGDLIHLYRATDAERYQILDRWRERMRTGSARPITRGEAASVLGSIGESAGSLAGGGSGVLSRAELASVLWPLVKRQLARRLDVAGGAGPASRLTAPATSGYDRS